MYTISIVSDVHRFWHTSPTWPLIKKEGELSMNERAVKERKGAIRFFSICLAVIMVCTIFIWGFQSDWGKVKIKRLTLSGPNGSTISTLMYTPKTATDENPAPVALILHGRSNHAHSNDTWSMELARRGYVVLSPDLQGGGESDPTVDRAEQSIAVAKYANSCPTLCMIN